MSAIEISLGRPYSPYFDGIGSGITAVVDCAWGDSGKGKVVSSFRRIDMGARGTGAHNVGHTSVTERGMFPLGLVPTTVVAHPEVLSVDGRNVAIDPAFLMKEIEMIEEKGVPVDGRNFKIDRDSAVILKWHSIRDALSEEAKGAEKVGSLGLGVGWAYSDWVNRGGLRVKDILTSNWREKVEKEFVIQRVKIEEAVRNSQDLRRKPSEIDTTISKEEIFDILEFFRDFVSKRDLITDTMSLVWDALDDGKGILYEDVHGTVLDVSSTGWPYTTAVNVGLGGIHRSFEDKAVRSVNRVVVAIKAFTTRVGGGPLPVEDNGDFGRWVIEKGEEWGTRSGRKRRGGPLDLPAMKRGLKGLGVRGIDSIALLKLDILSGLPEVPVCVAWDIDGQLYFRAPTFDPQVLRRVKPVIRTLKGWNQNINGVTDMRDLPPEAINFVVMVQNELGLPIELIGTGRHRDDAIYPRGEIFKYDSSQLVV